MWWEDLIASFFPRLPVSYCPCFFEITLCKTYDFTILLPSCSIKEYKLTAKLILLRYNLITLLRTIIFYYKFKLFEMLLWKQLMSVNLIWSRAVIYSIILHWIAQNHAMIARYAFEPVWTWLELYLTQVWVELWLSWIEGLEKSDRFHYISNENIRF